MTIAGQRTMKNLAIALVACLTCSLAQAADLSGVPRVVDGDTLAIGATRVRLEGIDAPETDQVCLNANGMRWACGIDARDQLAAHIAGRVVTCSSNGTDVYKHEPCWYAVRTKGHWTAPVAGGNAGNAGPYENPRRAGILIDPGQCG